ncbi:MAG: DEAD/DEAH box helicase family protein, partial [Fimbriimonadaceae bacterium]
MPDLFGHTMQVTLPRQFEVAGSINGNRIDKVGRLESAQIATVSPFPHRSLQAVSLEIADGRSVLLVDRVTSANLSVDEVVLVDTLPVQSATEANLEASRWLKPRPVQARDLTLPQATAICERVTASWREAFTFKEERRNQDGVTQVGLRPPQIGALHSALAHWSVSDKPATIVMPTGTGKTETMLALVTAVGITRLLVVVPNAALKDQIAGKFLTLGLLKATGVLKESAELPIVAVLNHRPETSEAVDELFLKANVIVTTMQVAGQCELAVQKRMAELCTHLFIDEAHHVAARTWQGLKDQFSNRRILQFTATPFRTDGKKVDGKFIYVYPLAKAQAEGYFRPITFEAIQGLDRDDADDEIVRRVGNKLDQDLSGGFDHLVMARANSIERAVGLHRKYEARLRRFSPVLIHSRMSAGDRLSALARLRSRDSRIVVCVDMLGEGFDLPQLKIAALHERHKSVAITLQFTGRFTRDASGIGDATVIANVEQSDVNDALRSLYAEDADWNFLLNVLSETRTDRQLKRSEVLEGFREALEGLPMQTLNPKMSTVVYRTQCEEWRPHAIDIAIPNQVISSGPVVNDDRQLAVFVTKDESYVKWSSTKEIVDVQWNLYLVHWDRERNLLFINSSKPKDSHEPLAKALCGDTATRVVGETIYRVLDGINRLVLMNLGLSSPIGRHIRYTMFVGSDITAQLEDAAFRMKRK